MSRVTTTLLREKKARKEKITMLTAYDYSTAVMVDQAGIDVILVGDSLGNVVLGYETTLPVTMDDMIHHTRAVARGTKNSLLVGDMPFLSYHISIPEAVRNAGRFIQEGGAQAVKLEGGEERVETIKAVLDAQIPVMGHIGLTPQSVHQFGGFKVQGKDVETARKLVRDAKALEAAGVFAIVLECVPAALAERITAEVSVPTIGIGAGPGCDGQVLVINDMLGLYGGFTPKFVKKYANLNPLILEALRQYKEEVESGAFPAAEHCFAINEEVLEKLY
ncbi:MULTISPECIES: 3-methyl-2-oxobutanoate hydroxymethyltransferase [Syntrophothermus]|uniref:3-methyl-2-oxobutanoate hydroxymethyltransferase n=1 Tax=Syntrophothermus lipocalidus (strain DSM 12680 / TGB-C1) TaxID=643648 RepID=D7CJ47_SYNLT|nr:MULTISPECIES: 3-methyl-2-oxobutanoate hydroxymethyltransferase [Syntrophothermus]ADI00936.1 3-methyl-2-oxobutanoatehydroxymethyltransferase [Syntrophothermus lipocalidus DSM 12680]NSW82966.1 3-methyl-2-oxobutanoate hydroxymethyltransferase [Syntrophothermus sp.]